VKKKQADPEMKHDPTAPSLERQRCAETVAEVDAEGAGVRADGLLAKRCLAGEVAAWEELYSQCHEPLLVSIRIMLGSQSTDGNLVDEIAARVWYALVANDGALLARYKTNRGARLITFMRMRANSEIVRYIRGEVRQRKRELAALRQRPQHQGQDGEQPVNVLAEFFGTLTAREQVFCSKHLLGESSDVLDPAYSASNVWQLSHRIRRKLLRFIGQ
jgi:hypothetical protein